MQPIFQCVINDELTCISVGTIDEEITHIIFMSLRGSLPEAISSLTDNPNREVIAI